MKGFHACFGWAAAAWFLALAFPSAAAPLPQDVYIWQRAWTEPVRAAVREHGGSFATVVVLAAEADWSHDRPQVVRVPLDFGLLKGLQVSNHVAVGLALRVDGYGGTFATNDPGMRLLSGLAKSLVNGAVTNGLLPAELHLDFDCAEAKLAGYRRWVEAIRRAIAPVPLRITVLPVWLKHPEFRELAQAAGGFVLQVHSLQRPRSVTAPFVICDPVAARAAVALAGQAGVPFRVALPTYGYLVAFMPAGKFLGLSAEGPAKNWPPEAGVREVRAEALPMADLVQGWAANRPATMAGIIWYRFPVAGDAFNWRWPTLRAMLAQRVPRESVSVLARRSEPRLVEIWLENDGERDEVARFGLTARWDKSRLVAGDAVGGFELVRTDVGTVRLQAGKTGMRLSPGDQKLVGWLRFDKETEVKLERRDF